MVRNISKIFFVLGILQLCLSWMQGNFLIKQFENTSKQVVDALIELSKANERHTQMTLSSQKTNAQNFHDTKV
jgi:hypothetical protein